MPNYLDLELTDLALPVDFGVEGLMRASCELVKGTPVPGQPFRLFPDLPLRPETLQEERGDSALPERFRLCGAPFDLSVGGNEHPV